MKRRLDGSRYRLTHTICSGDTPSTPATILPTSAWDLSTMPIDIQEFLSLNDFALASKCHGVPSPFTSSSRRSIAIISRFSLLAFPQSP